MADESWTPSGRVGRRYGEVTVRKQASYVMEILVGPCNNRGKLGVVSE